MTFISRIIVDTAHDAPFNMAADLDLLSQCEITKSVFVRIYSWEKPCITLGISEDAAGTLDREAMQRRGVEWIRRPTGGRSVLHDHDITYSCIFSASIDEMGTTLMETYRVICNCLIQGLNRAGVECTSHDSAAENGALKTNAKLPCFLSPNRHEIMVDGKKLIGSAQKRTAKAVLQHGSIPLTPDFRSLPDFLCIPPDRRREQKQLLLRKTTCVEEITSKSDERKIRDDLAWGFCKSLPFVFSCVPWSSEEIDRITRTSRSAAFSQKWYACTP